MNTTFKKRLQILLYASLFSSATYGVVPYNNQGVVTQVLPGLNQIIVDSTVYALAPGASIRHSANSDATIVEQIEIGQSIGYLLLESESEMNTEQITDIWIIE